MRRQCPPAAFAHPYFIIDDQYAVALAILSANMDLLKQTAIRLLEDEVIEGARLADLLKSVQADKIASLSLEPATGSEEIAA